MCARQWCLRPRRDAEEAGTKDSPKVPASTPASTPAPAPVTAPSPSAARRLAAATTPRAGPSTAPDALPPSPGPSKKPSSGPLSRRSLGSRSHPSTRRLAAVSEEPQPGPSSAPDPTPFSALVLFRPSGLSGLSGPSGSNGPSASAGSFGSSRPSGSSGPSTSTSSSAPSRPSEQSDPSESSMPSGPPGAFGLPAGARSSQPPPYGCFSDLSLHRSLGVQEARPETDLSARQASAGWAGIIQLLTFRWTRGDAKERHGGRYEYTALEADSGSQERLQQERKARERARAACLHYLRACPRYSLVHHLNDIGSRVDKHWFVVRDASVKTERLLTLVPRAAGCPIACSPATRATILELFHALQHPYIYPVLDLDFREATGQSYVILVLPFNSKGSLKDLIYKSRWQDDWSQKYGQRSEGLPVWQVQRLGRQILEALLFLRERGFPPLGHLHSGNVILQNGVARLTGLENTLLGHTSRVHPIVWGLARADPAAVDVVCFGHVLFEMCAGYELCAPRPSVGQLADLAGYPAVQEILELIFAAPDGRFPGLQELLLLDFFRNIDLREMRAAPLPQAFRTRMSTSTLNLLSEIRRHQSGRRTRRCHSASTSEEPSPPPRERRSSAADGWEAAEDEEDEEDAAEAAAAGAGAEADDEDDDPVQEPRQSSPAQEHRDLSLHRQSESPVPLETRCLLR